jgi:hypothetical protein
MEVCYYRDNKRLERPEGDAAHPRRCHGRFAPWQRGRRWTIHWLAGALRRANQRRQRMVLSASKLATGPPLIRGPVMHSR